MELEKKHREALLEKLQQARIDLEIVKECLLENRLENIKGRFEIECFLTEQKIILIEQSLINNEIDF